MTTEDHLASVVGSLSPLSPQIVGTAGHEGTPRVDACMADANAPDIQTLARTLELELADMTAERDAHAFMAVNALSTVRKCGEVLKAIRYEIQKQKTWNGQESVYHAGLPPIIQKRIEKLIDDVLGSHEA